MPGWAAVPLQSSHPSAADALIWRVRHPSSKAVQRGNGVSQAARRPHGQPCSRGCSSTCSRRASTAVALRPWKPACVAFLLGLRCGHCLPAPHVWLLHAHLFTAIDADCPPLVLELAWRQRWHHTKAAVSVTSPSIGSACRAPSGAPHLMLVSIACPCALSSVCAHRGGGL